MKKTITGLAVCLWVVAAGFSNSSLASPPRKDELVVSAQTSNGSAGQVAPSVPGSSYRQWFYFFCLPTGGSLNQTFPLQFQLNNTNGIGGESVPVSFDADGSISSFTTPPSGFNISDDGVVRNKSFTVATGILVDGEYTFNLQIPVLLNNKVNLSHDTIHVHVTVGSGCTDSKPSCLYLVRIRNAQKTVAELK